MLSKQELDNIRAATEPWKGIADVQAPLDVSELLALLDHIAELEENATAQALALKVAKAMQQAETERADADAARLDFVEKMARQSRTGVSFDWRRHVYYGMVLERGYRVMWHHKLNDRADNIRDAIDQAMSSM